MTTSTARHPMTPAVPPSSIQDVYTPDEIAALFGVIRERGPWPLVNALHFSSTEEYLAVAGGRSRKPNATMADFAAPLFRGYLAKEGVALYDEVHDIYFSRKLLEYAKGMYGAKYGLAHHMLFNTSGPAHSFDAGHFDGGHWRGLSSANTPIWLTSVMAKSGLFAHWEAKSAQVITYFYDSDLDGGFTYWPDGPELPPARFAAPFWNTALLSDNSRMYHRREGNGPRDRRDMPEMVMESLLHREAGQWVVRNGDREIGRYVDADARSLFHYTALVFEDLEDATRYLEHTDDLTTDKVFDVLGDDLSRRGIDFSFPDDPLTDTAFISLLTDTYAMFPSTYPAEAPLDVR